MKCCPNPFTARKPSAHKRNAEKIAWRQLTSAAAWFLGFRSICVIVCPRRLGFDRLTASRAPREKLLARRILLKDTAGRDMILRAQAGGENASTINDMPGFFAVLVAPHKHRQVLHLHFSFFRHDFPMVRERDAHSRPYSSKSPCGLTFVKTHLDHSWGKVMLVPSN